MAAFLHFSYAALYGRYFGQIFFIMNVGSKMDQFWHVQKTNIVKTFNQESISGKYKVLGSFVQRITMNKCFQNINCPSVSYNFVCKKVGRVGYTGRLLVAVGVNVLEMFNTDVDQRVRDLSFFPDFRLHGPCTNIRDLSPMPFYHIILDAM